MKERVFKLPNELIVNADNLHPSAIHVAAVLYANMNRHRKFTSSLANIATMSFKCKDTVRQAIAELEVAGYIKRVRNFTRSETVEGNVYARTTYCILQPVERNYTLVPYAWLGYQLTSCTMQVLLACRMLMIQNDKRAFPSLRRLSARIKVSKSTVCNALACIANLGILLIEHCQKKNKAYSSNSYHLIHHSCEQTPKPLIIPCATQMFLELLVCTKNIQKHRSFA